jgi:hypothetical protein
MAWLLTSLPKKSLVIPAGFRWGTTRKLLAKFVSHGFGGKQDQEILDSRIRIQLLECLGKYSVDVCERPVCLIGKGLNHAQSLGFPSKVTCSIHNFLSYMF